MLKILQDLINRDLIYVTSLTKKSGQYVANKIILKVFYFNSPPILSAILALKQRAKMR